MPNLSYELIEEHVKHTASGEEVFQIRAMRDIPAKSVKKGDLGGWVGKNVKLLDNAWVSDNARVSGNAWVYENALVSGDALILGNACVHGNARVSGNALVYGNARVSGNALIYGYTQVYGNARVSDNARVSGDALVYGNAWVSGDDIIKASNDLINIINPSGYPITVTRKYFYVACKPFPIGSVEKNLRTTAIEYKFSESQYKKYKRLIRATVKFMNTEDI